MALDTIPKFSYAVAVEMNPIPAPLPEDTCFVTLKAGQYAVFRKRGHVKEIPLMFDAIYSTWMPTSGKQMGEGPEFERYPPEDNSSTPLIMTYEIWIPVAE